MSFDNIKALDAYIDKLKKNHHSGTQIFICGSTACRKEKSQSLHEAFQNKISALGLDRAEVPVSVNQVGCFGSCSLGPMVLIQPDEVLYTHVKAKDVEDIINKTVLEGKLINKLLYKDPVSKQRYNTKSDIPFFAQQKRLVLKNFGLINPRNIDDYLKRDGYKALSSILKEGSPGKVIDRLEAAVLRGRGWLGFPMSQKIRLCLEQNKRPIYLLCNTNESDPESWKDRSILEADPHSLIEGLLIGGYTVNAEKAVVYIRKEHHLATEILKKAIDDAKAMQLLGDNILGSSFSMEIEIYTGQGGILLGEETAMLAEIEGGEPRPKQQPPYPTETGLLGQPTVLGNVETWVNFPLVINMGPDEYRKIGTEFSIGTKVFSLYGKPRISGHLEVPMGTDLRKVIFDIAGGVADKKRKFKAVRLGGALGPILSKEYLDTPLDFENFDILNAYLGGGGLKILDDRDCVVNEIWQTMRYIDTKSCKQCPSCTEILPELIMRFQAICEGEAEPADLRRIEELSVLAENGAVCKLGKSTVPRVKIALQSFRNEFETHVYERRCPAGVCQALTSYYIEIDNCQGCGLCKTVCPENAISGNKKEPHVIDQVRCIKCGSCFDICNFDSIVIGGADEIEQKDTTMLNQKELDREGECILCKTCSELCSTVGANVISTENLEDPDEVVEPYLINAEACIGCAVCAKNCPTHFIPFLDENNRREIWGMKFEFLKCKECGKEIITKTQAEFYAKQKNLPVETFDYCDDCNRKRTAKGFLNIMGGEGA